MPASIGTPILWTAFLGVVAILLGLDLWVFHRRPHAIGMREAWLWSAAWVGAALGFGAWIYLEFGRQPGLEYVTGYVIELALSIDNLFVFLVIFRYFAVPEDERHRVLYWGIIGAVLLRAGFVALGAALISRFEWILFVFGAFLLYAGYRLLIHDEPEIHPERNPVVRLVQRLFPVASSYHGKRFLVRRQGRILASPLLLVLVVIEATDVMFAVDSIPAVFAVTRDPFLVFSSNILAVLGLRSLFFLLAGLIHRFRFLNYGLGLVLIFVGAKMLTSEFYVLPIGLSLGIVTLLLGGSIVVSWLLPAGRRSDGGEPT